MALHRRQREGGQASPEWLGLILVVALFFAGLVAAGVRVPGSQLAQALAGKLVCAVDFGADCDREASVLIATYGPEIAELVADHVPLLDYEQGMSVVPIDWRTCRENDCAEAAESGRVTETSAGDPVTLFSHVVDCRDPGAPEPPQAECSGGAAGHLYLQFWAYYPDSQTDPYGKAGYHPDDWESYQVRIAADGSVAARASSHHGYNGRGGDPVNDTGWLPGNSAWTPGTGRYEISAGSHAGRVGSHPSTVPKTRPAWKVHLPQRVTRPSDIRLVPIESIRSEWDEYVGSEKHLPAWLKDVYLDPEATGTGG